MDTTLLKQKWPSFVNYLRSSGMAESSISAFVIEYNAMMSLPDDMVQDMEAYLEGFIHTHFKRRSTWKRYNIIKKIVRYVLYDEKPFTMERMLISEMPDEFQHLINKCIKRDKEKGNSKKNQKNYEDSLRTFFAHLCRHNVTELKKADEQTIQSYFTANGQIIRGHNTLKLIKRFLNLCVDLIDTETYQRLLSFLPDIKRKYKAYPALTDDEAKLIQDVLLNEASSLPERTLAIGSLAFYTGLRTSDIVNLTIDDIDWKSQTITVVQQKTQVPIVIKLNPVFGNHIYRYIKQERPKSKSRYIFLRPRSHEKMDSHDAYKICVDIMYQAGIRQVDSMRGFHLFRHHLATKMINNGSDFSIVSAALGHRDPRTTFDYLSSDYQKLKECALPISKYTDNEND